VIARFAGTMARQIVERARPPGLIGLAVVLGVVLVAILAPLHGYPVGADVDPAVASRGPCADHWLGTDHLGRDVFWRLLLASRAFVGPGALSVAVATGMGVPLGAVAGWSDHAGALVARTVVSSIATVPRLVLVLLGCSIYGNGWLQLALAAGLGAAPALAEAVRERVERLRIEEFVLAARAHGLPDGRILWVHLVLVASGRAIARHALEAFGGFVVVECTLSYLGSFGVQEPDPSWGNMLAFDWGRGLAWSSVAPALAIWATVGGTALASRLFAEVDDG
jgi:peptide/nickel transport system permease protein